MFFEQSTTIIFVVFIFVRIYYNLRCATYSLFAFTTSIITLDLLITLLGESFFKRYVITAEPYSPLLVLICFFIIGYFLYQLLMSQWFRELVYDHFSNQLKIISQFQGTIYAFLDVITIILSYQFLSQLPDISSTILVAAATNQSTGLGAKHVIIALIALRFIYNLLHGNYKTGSFWLMLIIWIFISSLTATRENFALNVICFVVIVSSVFQHMVTELNYYKFFADSGFKESTFAYLTHLATAVFELLASIMIYSIFVNSFADVQYLQQYYTFITNTVSLT